ncbi:hypothetical protein GCM10009836_04230 [Pseudonocardia ailaonensis]|uniref:Uncharacterized protein n=2 Tax=Pseudonocardia ailaonensis TaxID=367279 RepID=A0ABN2MKU8_9PSEU
MRSAAAAAVRRFWAPKPIVITVVGTISATRIPVSASIGVTQPSAANQTAPAVDTRPTTGAAIAMLLSASSLSIGSTQAA